MPEKSAEKVGTAAPAPTHDELKLAYEVSVRNRITDQLIVNLVNQGRVKFAIWGPGEEIHGTATALAFHKVVSGPDRIGMSLHYRSGTLAHMWCELHGKRDFSDVLMAQQLSKSTDVMSGGGRQMVYHLSLPDLGILPIQSPVGMQCDKGAGYAKGFHLRGIRDGLAVVVIGDGSVAEGDMHDMMHAASIWGLPLLVLVTDNKIAISVTPEHGRGIKDFELYSKAFGFEFFTCRGDDWHDSYQTHYAAAKYCVENQAPALIHVTEMPRLNGHSSAGTLAFEFDRYDPLPDFGKALVAEGVLAENQIVTLKEDGKGKSWFAHHDLGEVGRRHDAELRQLIEDTFDAPDPDPATVYEYIYPPMPECEESEHGPGQTAITYAVALREAQKRIFAEKPHFATWGEDTGCLGGVFQATAGLKTLYPERVLDAPINEPMIVGTAMGAALHEDVGVIAEVQFGDYSLNCLHWFVYLGNLYWSSGGDWSASVICRMPTDPFGGGAIYHSMSVDGLYSPIPGMVMVMPSTSWDAYGLLRTLADYGGPSLFLEPKWMYRQTLGPAFPGEPTDPAEVKALKQRTLRGESVDVADIRVPLGKGAVRRAGDDVTIVAWGRAVWTALDAAKGLAEEGIEAEVIDLRTLIPADMPLIQSSVDRTGALVVASEDRVFAGYAREIQGAMIEANPGLPTKSVGMKNVPAVAQSPVLEKAVVLNAGDVASAAREVVGGRGQSGGVGGWSWIPRRYELG